MPNTNTINEHAEYNGWDNYLTWVVNLWISDEPDTDQAAFEVVESAYRAAAIMHAHHPRMIVAQRAAAADALRNLVEQWRDTIGEEYSGASNPLVTGLFADLITGALDLVDWRDIAEHYRQRIGDDPTSAADD